MSLIDWAIVAIIAISTVVAANQGFFFEVFALAGTVIGYLLAAWEYWRVAPWFQPYVKSAAIANVAGFVTIFAFVVLIAKVAGRLSRWAVREVGLGWADRALGAAFGLVRAIVVITVLVMAVTTFMPESKWLETSELSRYFLLSARSASWLAPSDVRNKFKEGVAFVRKTRIEGLGAVSGAAQAEKSGPSREVPKPQ
jgi:membrane protein required for colicin V production